MEVHGNHAQKIKTNERTGKNIEGKEDEMVFALITTSQLIVVNLLIVTVNAIWFNPDLCPKKWINTYGQQELREVCELQYYGYNKGRWVVKE